MIIFPAIDIIEGQCVRLSQGDYTKKTVYHSDPVAVAERFAAAGAELLHLVDLDGAKAGRPQNLETIGAIAAAVDIPVELGGGLRTPDTVIEVLEAGVERAILGSAVLHGPGWLEQLVTEYGARIVVGIDARDGMAAVSGWQETSNVPAVDLALSMKDFGVEEIIYTDIATDGMLQGPNLEQLRQMAENTGMKIVASGGVSSIADIEALLRLEPLGVYAAIVGRALYTGDLDLEEAIAAGRRGMSVG